MKANEPLRRIRRGDVALGMFALEFASTGLARTAASAGAEFIVFDQEHTGWTTETVRQLLASARAFEIAPLVRVPTSESHGISIALALGALGVMVPMVDTPEEAEAIVAAAKYPPAGKRGFAVLYVDEHEGDVEGYMRRANEETAVVVMIETASGLENVDAIARVPGVDVLWVGHYDLTASLGIPGDFENPTYLGALESIVRRATRTESRPESPRTVSKTRRCCSIEASASWPTDMTSSCFVPRCRAASHTFAPASKLSPRLRRSRR